MTAKITAEEVREALSEHQGWPYHHTVARALCNPAIQRLVAQKLVEGMSEGGIAELQTHLWQLHRKPEEQRTALLNALCPTTGEG